MGPGKKTLDFSREFKAKRQRQNLYWFFFFMLVLFLLAIYSGGFFLFATMVTGILFVTALAFASISLVGLEISRSFSRLEITLGELSEVKLILFNKKSFAAPWLFWKDYIDQGVDVEGSTCQYGTIAAKGNSQLEYRLHSTRRGLFKVGPVVVEASDPFGLIRRFMVSPQIEFITVLPQIIPIENLLPQGQSPLHQVPRRRSFFEDPSRFMGLRDYRPGDSMRRIHWKATARSGKLQVKLFEPSTLTGAVLAVDMGLDSYPQSRLSPEEIDPLLELTITAAASIADLLLAADQKVGLLSNGADGAEKFTGEWSGGIFRRLDDALAQAGRGEIKIHSFIPVEVVSAKGSWQREKLLHALARLIPSGSISLGGLLDLELPGLSRSDIFIILTPSLSAELCHTLETLKRSRIDTTVIWIKPENLAETTTTAEIPMGIPIYRIRQEADLTMLGAMSL